MRTVVVDSHNEVLPYWFEEYLRLKLPLVIVRIDQHHDMNQECPALPAREGRHIFSYLAKIMPSLSEYAKRKLNEGNFTCPAFHYGVVGALYHFNPRGQRIESYGRVVGSEVMDPPRTTEIPVKHIGKRVNKIIWDAAITRLRLQGSKTVPVPQRMHIDLFKDDLEKSSLPVAICFDLDGVYGIDDKMEAEEVIGTRLKRAKVVLDCISSPVLVCIARSQTPKAYVPPHIVDHLQQVVVDMMDRRCASLYNQVFPRKYSCHEP